MTTVDVRYGTCTQCGAHDYDYPDIVLCGACADKMRTEWRMCGSKVAYGSAKEARTAIHHLIRQRGTFLRAYRCPHCGLWHLTRRPEGQAA